MAALPVLADDAKPAKETNLDEITVTATRTEHSLADTPGAVTVITRKDFEKRNIQSLDGALKEIPGVYNRREMEFSTLQPVINIRGIAGHGRTHRSDARPVFEPLWRVRDGGRDKCHNQDAQQTRVLFQERIRHQLEWE